MARHVIKQSRVRVGGMLYTVSTVMLPIAYDGKLFETIVFETFETRERRGAWRWLPRWLSRQYVLGRSVLEQQYETKWAAKADHRHIVKNLADLLAAERAAERAREYAMVKEQAEAAALAAPQVASGGAAVEGERLWSSRERRSVDE